MKAIQTKTRTDSACGSQPFFSKKGRQGSTFFSRESSALFLKGSGRGAIQKKLTVGQPNDLYEKEADHMADKVVQRSAEPLGPVTPLHSAGMVQEKCAHCENEEKLQRKPAAESSQAAPGGIEKQLASSKGAGSPLPEQTRGQMEASFGTSFSHVKVHTDHAAVQMSKGLQARAFTHGSDIYFNSSKYDDQSKAGKHLLAHELTHVVQQGASQNRHVPTEVQRQPIDSNAGQSAQPGAGVETDLSAIPDFNAADWLTKANIPANTIPPGVMENEDFKLGLLAALNPLSTSVIVPLNSAPDKYNGLPEKHMIDVQGEDAMNLYLNSTQGDDASFTGGAGMGAVSGANKALGIWGFKAAGPNAIGIVAFPMSKTVRVLIDKGKWSTPGPVLPGSKIVLGHTALYARVDGKIVVIKSYGPTSLTDAAMNMKGVATGKGGVDASVLDHLSGDAPGGNMFEVNAARSIEYPVPKDVVEQFVKDLPDPGPVAGGAYTARPETANLCNGKNCVHWAVDYIENRLGVPIGKGGVSQNDVGGVDTARQGRVMELLQDEHPRPLELADGTTIQPSTGKIPTSLKVVKWGGRICLAINIGSGIYKIATASDEERLRAIGEVGGNLFGGYIGGEAGVGGCVALGLVTDGLGLIACGIVGGIFGAEAGEALGGAVMSLPQAMAMAPQVALSVIVKMMEVSESVGDFVKGTVSFIVEENIRVYEKLNYKNWDTRYLPTTLQNDINTFGQMMWRLLNDQKDVPADADQSTKFYSVLQKALLTVGQLGIPQDLMMRITQELSDINKAGGGPAYAIEEFTGINSIQFVQILEQVKLQYKQDPLYQANMERFWNDKNPERHKESLNIQYRPAIEARAKINVNNWEPMNMKEILFSAFEAQKASETKPANAGPADDGKDNPDTTDETQAWYDYYSGMADSVEGTVSKLGNLVWNFMGSLNFTDFTTYMYSPLSTFNPDRGTMDDLVFALNETFKLLNQQKGKVPPNFLDVTTEYLLGVPPTDLVDDLVQYDLLHYKKAPSEIANLAIIWMNVGFAPW